MSSEPIRDPVEDHLLTPQNSAFIIIDYQPVQVNSIASMERQRLVSNIIRATKAAILYDLPIVHSTVNVKTGLNKPRSRRCANCWIKFRSTIARRSTPGRASNFARQSKQLGVRSSS